MLYYYKTGWVSGLGRKCLYYHTSPSTQFHCIYIMEPTRWALLCGVKFCMKGTSRDTPEKKRSYLPLYGCVKDVQDVYKLTVRLGTKLENITTLTATANAKGDGPIEEPDRLPHVEIPNENLTPLCPRPKMATSFTFTIQGTGSVATACRGARWTLKTRRVARKTAA